MFINGRMAPQPVDSKLYQKIKDDVMKKNIIHSAYRSGTIVKRYKEEFSRKYGDRPPYTGKKEASHGLTRWFKEKRSRDKDGNIGYTKNGDVYRPQIRITSYTPVTWNELSDKEIKRAKVEKKTTGRVRRFNVDATK